MNGRSLGNEPVSRSYVHYNVMSYYIVSDLCYSGINAFIGHHMFSIHLALHLLLGASISVESLRSWQNPCWSPLSAIPVKDWVI